MHKDITLNAPPPLPPAPFLKPNLSLFYYGLVVIGSTAVVLTIYNFIVVGWCRPPPDPARLHQSSNQSLVVNTTSSSFNENSNAQLISTFKYRKEEKNNEELFNNECVVCLSIFEDGQDVRRLSQCKHSFHAPCIDMWLYSHSDCPLCRTIVVGTPVSHSLVLIEEENSP